MNDDLEYTVEFDIEAIATKLVAAEATIIMAEKALNIMDAVMIAGAKLREAVANSDAEFCRMAIAEWEDALRKYQKVFDDAHHGITKLAAAEALAIDGGPGAWYAQDEQGKIIARGWDARERLLAYLVHNLGYEAKDIKYAEATR